MKTFQWPLRAFLFICFLQLISCTKSIDPAPGDSISLEGSSNATLASEFPDCKLRYIIHRHNETDDHQVKGTFTYNKAGNPVSLTYAEDAGEYGHYFFYDKNNRLTEYRMAYSINDPTEALSHRYGYNSANQIVTDTLMNTSSWDGDTEFAPIGLSKIEYDNVGRIVKETIQLYDLPKRYPTYTYDARGNLAVKGWKSSSYDNKVSLFRAHPVFQFINRNYSRNNGAAQPKYNSKGLPLSMHPANDDFFNAYAIEYYPQFPGGITKAGYDCM